MNDDSLATPASSIRLPTLWPVARLVVPLGSTRCGGRGAGGAFPVPRLRSVLERRDGIRAARRTFCVPRLLRTGPLRARVRRDHNPERRLTKFMPKAHHRALDGTEFAKRALAPARRARAARGRRARAGDVPIGRRRPRLPEESGRRAGIDLRESSHTTIAPPTGHHDDRPRPSRIPWSA